LRELVRFSEKKEREKDSEGKSRGRAPSSSFAPVIKDNLLGVILHTFTHKLKLSTANGCCHEN